MDIKQTFGTEIKKIRMAKKISQKDLCEGICSQPMLSSIESGKYIPNSQILVQLCQRLEIDTDLLILHDHYQIGATQKINEVCEELCNRHKYVELANFLQQDSVIASIETSEQTQAYYYYLACSQFHIEKSMTECKKNFHLALAEADTKQNKKTLTRLILACLGIISAKEGQPKQSENYFNQAFANLEKSHYEKNQNILYYLYGVALYLQQSYSEAVTALENGIQFTTRHDTHFMLANMFFLLAQIVDNDDTKNEIHQKGLLLSGIFQEIIYKI